ncbi:hypothetical protein LEMA_P025830.1 [Paecilomyces variotii No. 5]|uniref:Uncharacterized protein n=1 Tax=Byssochlamys spectabilis (strain No. 5 / NBRC 109023) TaxID=1356009 RepID=V5FYM8_BYSSN|nr:hypothetical protein LEMA_P025830.1 [Paecilomyces variotii No. 5]
MLISEYFNAANVTTDRLMVPSSHNMGIFGNGRTSTPVKPRDLPDLTFSEMKFLRKQGDKNERRSPQNTSQRYLLTSPTTKSHRKMPQYFSPSDPPVNRHTARQNVLKGNGEGTSYHEASSRIHLSQNIVTSPLSRKSKPTKRSDYSSSLPNRIGIEKIKPCGKMPVNPTSRGISPYADDEGRAPSKELDASLLTYVTGILLNKPNSRKDRKSEVTEDKKPYYNLDDLQKLCKDRESLHGLQDGVSSAGRPVADPHKQRHSYTRSKHHCKNKRSMHSSHSGTSSRSHSRHGSSHKESTKLSIHADSASRVVLPNIVEPSPYPTSEKELSIDHRKQYQAYHDNNFRGQQVRGGAIEKSDEGFGQYQETAGSLDLRTEYAISESIPSVSEVLFNLYGDSYIEDLRDMEKNEILDKHELPEEIYLFSAARIPFDIPWRRCKRIQTSHPSGDITSIYKSVID